MQAQLDGAFLDKFAQASSALLARQTNEFQAQAKEEEQTHLVKLGRLAAAFNAYHAEHGHYPPAAIAGPDGKTPHSWRVELLPYLGEQELYARYKLDEPWDSEHNQQLIKNIPDIYSTTEASKQGDSDYFVVTGRGTLFDADAPANRESMTDAASETILVVQSQHRIAWTKPEDIAFPPALDAPKPFRGRGESFHAAFADGSVKLVPRIADPATLRALFTKAGGDEAKLR